MFLIVICLTAFFTFISVRLKEKNRIDVIDSGSAKKTYLDNCAVCHGRDGSGTKHAKGFRGKQLDPEYIKKMIQSGNTVMPKFHFINGKTADDLADYVHNMK